MAFGLPPPPNTTDLQDPSWRDWFFRLRQYLTLATQILWSQLILPTVTKNTFLGGPTTGADAQAGFRALVAADLGTGTADSSHYLRGDLTWATVSGGATLNNVISTPTTIATDTSYPVISYLTITSDLTVNGNVMVIG